MAKATLFFLGVVLLIGNYGVTAADRKSKWQADRIVFADQGDRPIDPSMDDAEAFGDDAETLPLTHAASAESSSEEEHPLDKRNLKSYPHKAYSQKGMNFHTKAKLKPARWMNEVLAARGILSRYQVGQKKEFDFAPKAIDTTYQCGMQKIAPNDWWNNSPRESNGLSKRRVEARRHSWPWQVDIFFYRIENGSAVRVHLCGGTLIDRWHVISAAHCNIIRSQNFALGRPKHYYVRLGQHLRSADKSSVQTIRVDKWTDHDGYNDSVSNDSMPKFFLYNDIAFLRLDRPVDLSDQVHPVCLDFNETPAFSIGTTCYATGWSLDEFEYQKWVKGEYSEVLNESKSKIAKDSYCQTHHSGYNPDVTLCTKYYPGHYSCHGDSGGPLQCERDGRFYLIGIVSYDVATSCRATGMTYFTKIRGLQSWIEDQIEQSTAEISKTM